jgi:hypothetical protein
VSIRTLQRQERWTKVMRALADVRVKSSGILYDKAKHLYGVVPRRIALFGITATEKREIARRCYEIQLLHACDSGASTATIASLIRGLHRLGTTNVRRRVEMFGIVADWAAADRGNAAKEIARDLAVDTKHRVLRLRKRSPERKQLLVIVERRLKELERGLR